MRAWIAAAALVVANHTQAQSVASRVTTAEERALITRLIRREAGREQIPDPEARPLGLASANPFIRAFTVRGMGRDETPSYFPDLAKALLDPDADVRATAADALAQSVALPLPSNSSESAQARHRDEVGSVRTALTDRLGSERDPKVRAAILEAVGRLAQGTAEQVTATAALIAPSLSANNLAERRGAIRGLFFLARKREARAAGAIPPLVTDKIFAMLDEPASVGFTPTDRFTIASTLLSAFALDDARSQRFLADREPFVRERGVVSLSRSADLPFIREQLRKAMADAEPVVRFRAINVYAQKLRGADGCAPLIALSRDANVTVALAATDALSGCRNDPAVASHLRSVADGFRDGDQWHLPVHAFVSLSVVDSAAARPMLPRFMRAQNFFVRMYADTAARLMRDVAALYALSRDVHPNVQASAIAALSALVGHAADSVYVRALASDDNQLLMSAAAALRGSTMPGLGKIVADRYRARYGRHWETDSDGNRALGQLATSLGERVTAVTDVATPFQLPSFDDLAALESATVRIEMADGGVATMKLHPFDAAMNASRFVRLARAGTFDGLTFHRVAPFFVVQGPGPYANEYSAPDKSFAREELALSNVRGSVGLSTRGRHTADGQIYVNTVDNVWLDHEFTIMGTITSGMDVFDRMQEGARIRRVSITP